MTPQHPIQLRVRGIVLLAEYAFLKLERLECYNFSSFFVVAGALPLPPKIVVLPIAWLTPSFMRSKPSCIMLAMCLFDVTSHSLATARPRP